jgi:hypothetical protein
MKQPRTLKKVFDDSLKLWGMNAQICMMAEEASELSVAALHLLRDGRPSKLMLTEFAEELADCQLMIEEMIYYFKEAELGPGYSFFDQLIAYRKQKEERLNNYLDEAEKKQRLALNNRKETGDKTQ